MWILELGNWEICLQDVGSAQFQISQCQNFKIFLCPKSIHALTLTLQSLQSLPKPILIHLRKLVHEACADCEETIKWSVPFFDYKGPFCSMAAFKAHLVFGFAKASLLPDPKGILTDKKDEAAGVMGRITNIKDLPTDKTILSFLKAAKKLNDDGVKIPVKKPEVKKELPVPDYMMKALKKNKKHFSLLKNSVHHIKEKTLNGSLKQNRKKHAGEEWKQCWSGWLRGRQDIGSNQKK